MILGIETSCDETSASCVLDGSTILSNVIASQADMHRRFGGVVPEVASRKHVEYMLPVLDQALHEAGVSARDLDAVAVTRGPGLVGALLVGISAAKAVAFALNIPILGVNHVEGHIYANILANPELRPPFICLTVSGGHTDLVFVPEHGRFEVLGRTRDDAAGEAFDKAARVLGLGYPGGPAIDRAAREGDPGAVNFPRAYLEEGSFDFSFSGLKTALIAHINRLKSQGELPHIPDIAASFQEAIVEILVDKTIMAAHVTGARRVAVSGGVAANSRLRERLSQRAAGQKLEVFYPPPVLCTDNAAMIACAGYYRFIRGQMSSLDMEVDPRLELAVDSV
ncbi:MAG TPA: tRNA (adenosine(37)-N6)-threonylcarbamoyltransferase complex transferase subunit TsaD [Firmicutes bacterium]|nr:tRNA (adenosine(37)-N6)-threonylcarbamoyltransferase complex transferase subunit TsaD [Bacillota bacterium]